MRDKCRLKNYDINLEEITKITGVKTPEEDDWAVNKKYCDDNSGKDGDGGNSFWGALFGGIAGGVSGALASLAT